MAVLSYLEAINVTLEEILREDKKSFIIGEDVGKKGGVFKVTQGLYDQFGTERVIDSPLTESAIVGVAIGAAMYGMRPIAEIQFADFIFPAVNQIISEAAKIRYRSNNDWNCPLVIRVPYGGGVSGGLYHSQSVEAIFASTPGLKVIAPSSPSDARGLLKAAMLDPDPVLFFEHKKAYRLLKEEVPLTEEIIPIGKAHVKQEGKDITVISYGYSLHLVLQVAKKLATEGISVHVLDLRTLYPLDKESIIAAVRQTGKVLLVTEDNKEGSIMSEVSAIIGENCLFDLDAPITRLAAPDVPAIAYSPPLEKAYLLTQEKIEKAIVELTSF